MSVVNGSSSASSSSHVGSFPTTTSAISTSDTTNDSSATPRNSRARRNKQRGASGSGGSDNGSSSHHPHHHPARSASAGARAAPPNSRLSASAPSFSPTPGAAFAAGADAQRKPAAARKQPLAKALQEKKKPPPPRDGGSDGAAAAEAEAADDELCLLCADPIKFYAVGECNHTGMCSKCFMRMRLILHDKACPMCKTALDRVVVSRELRAFDSFPFWGDALGPDAVLDEPSEMIFVDCRAHYEALRALREFKCRVKKCKEKKPTLAALKEHLRRDHGAEFCELCLQHQHFFVQEQQVFTKASVKAHNVGRNRSAGAKSSGKDFHPMCQFCRKRFYGSGELFEHLERDHFKCHICKIEHEYYRNYISLETHFRRDHHLCEDPGCLSNRYVVFPNDIEYHAHMSSVHGVQNRLQFNFQVARGGGNPIGGRAEPVYPDDAPELWNFDAADEAPNPRAQQEFPALPTPSAPAPVPIIPPVAVRPRTTGPPAPAAAAAAAGPPRGQVVRNQRLAQALGLARPAHAGGATAAFEDEMKTPSYGEHLVEWGKQNSGYLTVVERRLERIVNDAKTHSVSLRFMPADERALMHELAAYYGVPSESFGEDPYRRISFFKKDSARVPLATLSSVVRGRAQQKAASAKLSFLPLRRPGAPAGGAGAGAAAAAAPAPPPRPVVRGWEKIEPKRAPTVRDAWSDDEDCEGPPMQATGAASERGGAAQQQPAVALYSNGGAAETARVASEFVLTYIEDEQ
ncbi:hypothetical protein PybrP1_005712 [[Pythium] brassicae (nom. inval.)]|nr:hypothetical protein PybrP1_005712 [[Pythium] brassicae (nom. inval.)]